MIYYKVYPESRSRLDYGLNGRTCDKVVDYIWESCQYWTGSLNGPP